MTTNESATLTLVDVAARMDAAAASGMQAQLQWLEDAALAIDAADLGDDGKAAATDLRAALGAIVHWARGPRDPKTLPELEAVVRTFTSRGTATLYALIARGLRELADARAGKRAICLDLAQVFEGLHKAQLLGTPPDVRLLERLASAKDELHKHEGP